MSRWGGEERRLNIEGAQSPLIDRRQLDQPQSILDWKKSSVRLKKTNFKCRLKLEFYDTFSSGGMFLSIENSIEKTYFSIENSIENSIEIW